MRRIALALVGCFTFVIPATVTFAGSQPSAGMVAPAGCAGAVYSWANVRKASVAHIEIRPDGVLLATVHSGPIGPTGSFTLPPSVTFVAGQHYTLLGIVADSSGRRISQSAAAWWGYC